MISLTLLLPIRMLTARILLQIPQTLMSGGCT